MRYPPNCSNAFSAPPTTAPPCRSPATASSISSYAQERGLGSLRVFGSVAWGTDGFESDIDLIGTPTRDLSLFELADIASFASELTGFPTEVHADNHVPEALRAAIDEAVAL